MFTVVLLIVSPVNPFRVRRLSPFGAAAAMMD
jgi:hypothetical protein